MPLQSTQSKDESESGPNVLFWLVPRSKSASKCLMDEENHLWVGKVRDCGEPAFAISLENTSSNMPGCLLTLGRNGDIIIREERVSSVAIYASSDRQSTDYSRGVHCQILLHSKTHEIIIRDKSSTNGTEIVSMPEANKLMFNQSGYVPRQCVVRDPDPSKF